jgi:hypothetical protein
MRRLVTWLLVTLGIAALVRKLRKREEPEWASEPTSPTTAPASTAPTTPGDTVSQGSGAESSPEAEGDPAAELRERLARSKAEMPASEESVEERRASVHEQGRAALDEMQPTSEPSAQPADEEQ